HRRNVHVLLLRRDGGRLVGAGGALVGTDPCRRRLRRARVADATRRDLSAPVVPRGLPAPLQPLRGRRCPDLRRHLGRARLSVPQFHSCPHRPLAGEPESHSRDDPRRLQGREAGGKPDRELRGVSRRPGARHGRGRRAPPGRKLFQSPLLRPGPLPAARTLQAEAGGRPPRPVRLPASRGIRLPRPDRPVVRGVDAVLPSLPAHARRPAAPGDRRRDPPRRGVDPSTSGLPDPGRRAVPGHGGSRLPPATERQAWDEGSRGRDSQDDRPRQARVRDPRPGRVLLAVDVCPAARSGDDRRSRVGPARRLRLRTLGSEAGGKDPGAPPLPGRIPVAPAQGRPPGPRLSGEAMSTRERAGLIGVLAAAFLVRVLLVLSLRGQPYFDTPIVDSAAYDEWAVRIAKESFWGDRAFYQDPLYPYG